MEVPRRMCVDRVTLVAIALAITAPPVFAEPSSSPSAGVDNVFPSTVSTYATSDGAGALQSARTTSPQTLSLRRPAGLWTSDVLEDDTGGKQSWWPVVYSAVIPGLGELSMGYWKRGVALMAVEALAWTGYFSNNNSGLDAREAYENFADVNWNQNKWVSDHPYAYPADYTQEELEEEGRLSSGSGRWPGYIPWVSKEEDKQHYYENIGKYDWYISGWADFDPVTQPHDTDLRTQYRSMRQESNDKLDTATNWVYLSLAARVISLVQTTLLVHKANHPGSDGQALVAPQGNQLLLRAQSRGVSGGEIALEYWFK